jgi:hypothetical protein
MRHRLYWGMASNVLAFEHLSGNAAVDRCRMLVDGDHLRFVLRTLIIVPAVLLATSIVGTIVLAASLGIESPATIGVCVLAFLWITIPASAAANTVLYRRLAALEAEAACVAASESRTAWPGRTAR